MWFTYINFSCRCGKCNGKGKIPCSTCGSRGLIKCAKCNGSGSLLVRSVAVVKWYVILLICDHMLPISELIKTDYLKVMKLWFIINKLQ